jgi:hypothetical protein
MRGAEAKTKEPTMGFIPDEGLRGAIVEFRDSCSPKVTTSSACCFLIRKGLEAVKAEKKKGASRG